MQKTNNLQEIFLTRARKQNIPVTMFLVNGFQLRGIITGFDCFVVILDSEGRQQVIYKHAISTIAPMRPVELREDNIRDRGKHHEKNIAPHENTAHRRAGGGAHLFCRAAVQLPVRPCHHHAGDGGAGRGHHPAERLDGAGRGAAGRPERHDQPCAAGGRARRRGPGAGPCLRQRR